MGQIDLGDDPHSCDDGIHAAATGAIWLGAIQGFAGLSVRHGELHLHPALPAQWKRLAFPLQWQGRELFITMDADNISITSIGPVDVWIYNRKVTVDGERSFKCSDVILPVNGTATREGK